MSDEETLTEKKRETFELWSFPLLKDTDSVQKQTIELEETKKVDSAPTPDPELEQLKNNLKETINCLSKAQNRLESLLKEIDEILLIDMIDIIKNVTKNITGKIINTDKESLARMISETLKQTGPYQSATIFLSETDHKRLEPFLADIEGNIKKDTSLQAGDFKIHTDTSQIRAILEDRLNKWFDWTS